MTHDELAGYTLLAGYGLMLLGAIKVFGLRRVLLAGYGLMLLGAIKVFGLRRVLLVILSIVLLGFGIAFRTFRGVTNRRY